MHNSGMISVYLSTVSALEATLCNNQRGLQCVTARCVVQILTRTLNSVCNINPYDTICQKAVDWNWASAHILLINITPALSMPVFHLKTFCDFIPLLMRSDQHCWIC